MSRQVSMSSANRGGREGERGAVRSASMSPVVAVAAERSALRRVQMEAAFTTPASEISTAEPSGIDEEVTPTVTQASPLGGGIDFRGVPVVDNELPMRAVADGKSNTMAPEVDNMEVVDGYNIAEPASPRGRSTGLTREEERSLLESVAMARGQPSRRSTPAMTGVGASEVPPKDKNPATPRRSARLRRQCTICGTASTLRWVTVGSMLVCDECSVQHGLLESGRIALVLKPQNQSHNDFDHLRRLREAPRARRLVEMRGLRNEILQ